MAFDETLADRARVVLEPHADLTERRMFGGVAFMLAGNMCCGVIGEDLMVRLGEEEATRALEEDGVRPMDFTGKPMKTSVYVAPEVTADDESLAGWVEAGAAYALSLPPKVKA
jgi:TfoX/Sxy family transcriptional regulator of competence genes